MRSAPAATMRQQRRHIAPRPMRCSLADDVCICLLLLLIVRTLSCDEGGEVRMRGELRVRGRSLREGGQSAHNGDSAGATDEEGHWRDGGRRRSNGDGGVKANSRSGRAERSGRRRSSGRLSPVSAPVAATGSTKKHPQIKRLSRTN